jgi:hypothetical protein
LETDYPYHAKDGICKYTKTKGKVDALSYVQVPKISVA